MEQPEELSWIDQALQGDEAGFGRLVTAYQKKVFAFILGMVRNAETADELTQTTFVKAWKSLKSFRRESAFQTWLFQIALNNVRSWGRWRRIRLVRERPLETPADVTDEPRAGGVDRHADRRADADPGRQLETGDLQRRIKQAVESLPPREKEVFTLRHFQDLPLKEIAEAMGIAEGSVKAHLFHALEKMRKALEE